MSLCRRAGVRVVALVLLLGSVAAPVSGASLDSADRGMLQGFNIRVSGAAAREDDTNPAVAYNPTSEQYLVVWDDGRLSGQVNIYGQLLSASGDRLGPNFLISERGAYSVRPAVVYNPWDDRYLVVWADSRDFLFRGLDIYGQFLNTDGEWIGANFRVSGGGATASEDFPAVAHNGVDNEYLVVWHDRRYSATHGTQIYAQRLGSDGVRIGTNEPVSGAAAVSASTPAVAHNPLRDEYLVVWEDARNWGTHVWDIYAQRLALTVDRIGPNVRISGGNATASEYDPAVIHNPTNDEYLVVWSDGRNSGSRGMDLYAQRMTGTGGRVGINRRVSGPLATSYEHAPVVAYNPIEELYLIVWTDRRNEPLRNTDIYAQLVNVAGTRIGPDFRVCGSGATGADGSPAVVYASAGHRFLVVWEDFRNGANRGYDIYAQRLNAGAAP